jgi:hypothetical protein
VLVVQVGLGLIIRWIDLLVRLYLLKLDLLLWLIKLHHLFLAIIHVVLLGFDLLVIILRLLC